MYAGTIAARNALSIPKPAIPARCSHGTSNGPSQSSDCDCSSGSRTRAAPMPSPTPSTAATPPSTMALPMMTRRDCFGVPPVAAMRARLRCCLRALTANAGPASSTTSISAITTIRAITASVVPLSVLESRASSGHSDFGGGSPITAREATTAPISLSWRTVGHDTGPPSTSQPVVPSARTPSEPIGPAAAGKVRRLVDSATPTMVGSAGAPSSLRSSWSPSR